ncbi:glycosyl hydrolase [Vallitalea okinawensis]|uniref:glycosyl hydrolase n=1 Tax=Vallitalea okinawensis TaxID=2078660 RepID=UPI000CFB63C8|nr:glycosyl hydrolase [Vallitalea okinawensis]
MKRIFFTFILIVLLSYLFFYSGLFERSIKTLESTLAEKDKTDNMVDDYVLMVEDNQYNYNFFEPTEGLYLGAYVLSNRYINHSIEEFDLLTGKHHQLNLTYIKAGQAIDKDFILNCIAELRTPYIIIYPSLTGDVNDYDDLITTLKSISAYEVPVFISIYPSPIENGVAAENYIPYFRTSYQLIQEIIESAAVVWSINVENYSFAMDFYPGDQYVDWIGMNLRLHDYNNNYLEDIISFYEIFQDHKPLIFNELAISHYSNTLHQYSIEEATDALEAIYSLIPSYPRIKGINYLNVNVTDQLDDVYSVTEDQNLLVAYRDLIANLKNVSTLCERDLTKGTTHYTYFTEILDYNDELYMTENYILQSLGSSVIQDVMKVLFNSKVFYSTKDIDRLTDYSIIEDRESKIILIK